MSIAYRHDQDRQGLQTFIGTAPWDDKPLRVELTRQVAEALGEADGVITFDPSAFPKKGSHSVGVGACGCDTPVRIKRECERRLKRNELARFYHHRARNLLPPRKFHQRR